MKKIKCTDLSWYLMANLLELLHSKIFVRPVCDTSWHNPAKVRINLSKSSKYGSQDYKCDNLLQHYITKGKILIYYKFIIKIIKKKKILKKNFFFNILPAIACW